MRSGRTATTAVLASTICNAISQVRASKASATSPGVGRVGREATTMSRAILARGRNRLSSTEGRAVGAGRSPASSETNVFNGPTIAVCEVPNVAQESAADGRTCMALSSPSASRTDAARSGRRTLHDAEAVCLVGTDAVAYNAVSAAKGVSIRAARGLARGREAVVGMAVAGATVWVVPRVVSMPCEKVRIAI